MKRYRIYPTTGKECKLLGSAVFQSLNKKEALLKFKNLDLYSNMFEFTLVEETIGITAEYVKPKILKIKRYEK